MTQFNMLKSILNQTIVRYAVLMVKSYLMTMVNGTALTAATETTRHSTYVVVHVDTLGTTFGIKAALRR